MSRQEIMLDNK